MATIAELRDGIIAGIKEKVPGLPTYKPYRGEFDAGSIAFKSPAVFVAFKGDKPMPSDGKEQGEFLTRWAAYIYVKGKGNLDLEIFEAVQYAVFEENWKIKDVEHSKNVQGSVLSVKKGGLVLMSVTWEHHISLGANIWDLEGVEVEEVLYSFTPKVGIPHEAEYLRM